MRTTPESLRKKDTLSAMMPDRVSSLAISLMTASGLAHENNITATRAVMLIRIPIFRIDFNYFFIALMVVVSPIQPPTVKGWPSSYPLKKIFSIGGKAAL